ncbi:hypothetical protein BTA51_04065 [Hahella sp. CCB-MM4]|uniref:HlyD family secretion protein n=1 Tax=Hahella sp. (strain CCB-MM4) TaxID=1926491 RepID=UPI000B9BE036|nr:HlyD family efflux transporter periplasmic adaptor subunit [Hahella sp. CCB-MM4]OZG74201.1 hypothetical protein BTA51_04065 [Hahella sp. CCB-MM4]
MKYRYPLLLVTSIFLYACSAPENDGWQGYIEGDSIFVAAPVEGRLESISVQEGDQVDAASSLFVLDEEPQRAILHKAMAQLESAKAELADLEKGKRPQEIEVIEAQYEQAKAAAALSAKQLKRARELYANNLTSRSTLDEAQTTDESNRQRVQEIAAQLETAKLAARPDQLEAAKARVGAAQAELNQATWQMSEKQQTAPSSGLVQQVLYRPGEFVAAGQPVVALLPPSRIKIRFYVPETALTNIRAGSQVKIQCDNCDEPFIATVRYISPTAEYTPPFIYSRENRDKFVYLVEAWPTVETAAKLHPGQPVDVFGSNTLAEQISENGEQ